MTGLIAMPLKSSQDSGLLTYSFDLGNNVPMTKPDRHMSDHYN